MSPSRAVNLSRGSSNLLREIRHGKIKISEMVHDKNFILLAPICSLPFPAHISMQCSPMSFRLSFFQCFLRCHILAIPKETTLDFFYLIKDRLSHLLILSIRSNRCNGFRSVAQNQTNRIRISRHCQKRCCNDKKD